MGIRHSLAWGLFSTLAFTSIGMAQNVDRREPGSEFGFDVIYQLSKDIGFDGGSNLDLEDDIGFTLTYGWRINPKIAIQFALDWNNLDYSGTLQSSQFPGVSATVRGEMESITPRVTGIYYFSEGALTPFVMGSLGWSFIDTNIPTGQVQVGCWWDPWWGNICTPYQPTLDVDEFTYQLGLGVRWDFDDAYSLTGQYNKSWIDLSRATSAPDVDQFKVGFYVRF